MQVQGLGTASVVFAGNKQRARAEVEKPEYELVPITGVSVAGRRLACFSTTPAPSSKFRRHSAVMKHMTKFHLSLKNQLTY